MIVLFLIESAIKLLQKDLEGIKNNNISIGIFGWNYLNITQSLPLYLLKDILGYRIDLKFYNDTGRSFHTKEYIFENNEVRKAFIVSKNL